MTPYYKRFIWILLASCLASSPTFTGCKLINPAPIEEGQDAVVVNAQRIQTSSLDVYQQVTEWELANRANLPVNVSRTVDKFRKEFKPAWELSRKALADYKAKRVDATALSKVNAALSATQAALLSLQLGEGADSAITEAGSALSRLIESVKFLTQKPQPPSL